MLAYWCCMGKSAIGAALVVAATASLAVLAATASLAGGCVSGPGYGGRRDLYVGGVQANHRDGRAGHHEENDDDHKQDNHDDKGH
jgi:hypothetical protein